MLPEPHSGFQSEFPGSGPMRMLLIEDNVHDAQLMLFRLGKMPHPRPQLVHAASLDQGLRLLESQTIDLIVTDLDLPDSKGLNTCARLCAAVPDIPVIVLTGSHDHSLGVQAIKEGAQDYLMKGVIQVHELQRVVLHARERQQIRRKLRNAKQELEGTLAQLRSLEAMRESLTHMVVHDLRSPLFGLRLYLESVLSETPEQINAELRGDITKAYEMSGRIVEMVSTILDVHRMESRSMPLAVAASDLRRLVEEAVEQLGGSRQRVGIRCTLPSLPLHCDPILIRRAIANLIANAIRFSPPSGEVIVAGSSIDNGVRLEVRDQGPGVPAASRTRIFEKFGSLDPAAKAHSTGLGLPFCKLVVMRHGGTLGIDERPGGGSIFWFQLPAVPQEEAPLQGTPS